jgi:hypothetical protein
MRQAGQWLRLIGLLIEMVGVVGVVREGSGQAAMPIRIPGGPVVSAAWVAVVSGFVIWLIGRILLAVAKPPRRGSQRPQDL